MHFFTPIYGRLIIFSTASKTPLPRKIFPTTRNSSVERCFLHFYSCQWEICFYVVSWSFPMEVLCSSDSFLFTFLNCRIVSGVKKLFPICFFALQSRKASDFHWNRRNSDSLPSGFPVRNILLSSLAREQKRHLRSHAKRKKQRTETRSSLARETEETENGPESPPSRASVRNSSYLTQKASHSKITSWGVLVAKITPTSPGCDKWRAACAPLVVTWHFSLFS